MNIIESLGIVLIVLLVLAFSAYLVFFGKSEIHETLEIAECPATCNGNCLSLVELGVDGDGRHVEADIKKAVMSRYGTGGDVSLHYYYGGRIYDLFCTLKDGQFKECKKAYIPMQYYTRNPGMPITIDSAPEGIMDIDGMYYAVAEKNGKRFLRVFVRHGYIDIPIDGFVERVNKNLENAAKPYNTGVANPYITENNFMKCINDGGSDYECCRYAYYSADEQFYLSTETVFFNLSSLVDSGRMRFYVEPYSYPPEMTIHVSYKDEKGRENRAEIIFNYEPIDCVSTTEDNFKKRVKNMNGKLTITIMSFPRFSEKENLPYYLSTVVDNRLYFYLFYGDCEDCRSEECRPGEIAKGNGDACPCTLSLASSAGECGRNCAIPVEMDYSTLARTVLEK